MNNLNYFYKYFKSIFLVLSSLVIFFLFKSVSYADPPTGIIGQYAICDTTSAINCYKQGKQCVYTDNTVCPDSSCDQGISGCTRKNKIDLPGGIYPAYCTNNVDGMPDSPSARNACITQTVSCDPGYVAETSQHCRYTTYQKTITGPTATPTPTPTTPNICANITSCNIQWNCNNNAGPRQVCFHSATECSNEPYDATDQQIERACSVGATPVPSSAPTEPPSSSNSCSSSASCTYEVSCSAHTGQFICKEPDSTTPCFLGSIDHLNIGDYQESCAGNPTQPVAVTPSPGVAYPYIPPSGGGGSSKPTGTSDCTYNQDCKKSDGSYAQQTCKGKKDSSNVCKADSNVAYDCTACGTVTGSAGPTGGGNGTDTCGNNPSGTSGQTPAGYYWKADCSKSCTITADKPHGDCLTNSLNNDPNKTAWCYGFSGGSKCLELTQGSAPSSGGTGGASGGVGGGSGGSCSEGAACDIPSCNQTQGGNPASCSACGGKWCNGGKCTCGGKVPAGPEVTPKPGDAVPSGPLSSEYSDYYTDGTSCTSCPNGNFAACSSCGGNPCKCVGGGGGNCPHYCWKKGKPNGGGTGGGGGGTGSGTPSPTGQTCDAEKEKLHIIIIGDGYSSDADITKFKDQADKAKQGLLNAEPYKSAGDIDIRILDPKSTNISYKDPAKKTFGCVIFDKDQFDPYCVNGNTKTDQMQKIMDSVIKEYPNLPIDQAHLKIAILTNSGHGVSKDNVPGDGVTNGLGGNFSIIQTKEGATDKQPQYVETFIHEVGGHAVGLLYDRYVLLGNQKDLIPDGARSNCTDNTNGEAFWNDVRKTLTPTATTTVTPSVTSSVTPSTTPTGSVTPTPGGNTYPTCLNYRYAPVTSDCGPQGTDPNTGKTVNLGGYSGSVMGTTSCGAKPDGTKPAGFDAYEQAWIKGVLAQYKCDSTGKALDNLNGCTIDPQCTQGQGHLCEIVCHTPTPSPTGSITPSVSPSTTGTVTPSVSPSVTTTVTPTPYKVSIKNNVFVQDPATIATGTQVVWTNNDTVNHTVTFDDGSFDKTIAPNETVSQTFSTAGTYSYYCKIHGKVNMSGKVIVQTPTPTPTKKP